MTGPPTAGADPTGETPAGDTAAAAGETPDGDTAAAAGETPDGDTAAAAGETPDGDTAAAAGDTAAGDAAAPIEAEIVIRRDDGFVLDLSARLDPGRTVALLGPNGSGKSTAVAALAGLEPLSEGRIIHGATVLDEPASGRFVGPEQRRFGVMFQDYLLFDHMTVTDNVAFGPRSHGLGRRRAAAVARAWLDRLDLGHLADRRPGGLSGGQRQRVAMARALAAEPRALLLDEPMAALDVGTRLDVRRSLADHLDRHHGPRLLITHEPTDAFVLADEVWVIENGRLTQRGTAAEIRRRPASPYVAAVAGTNLLSGRAEGGVVVLEDDPVTGRSPGSGPGPLAGFELRTADRVEGPVLISIHPRAVSLHTDRPGGSPRNVWPSVVAELEPLGDTTRIRLGPPLPLMVDVTPSAVQALGLRTGLEVWAATKATEVRTDSWEGRQPSQESSVTRD